jgi:hypothetical protein
MTSTAFQVVRATDEDEIRVRRFFVSVGEPEWAVHSQLKDYFLTNADNFGAGLVQNSAGKIVAIAMYSLFSGTLYVHEYMGPIEHLELVRQTHGVPVQVVLRDGVLPLPTEKWRAVLHVSPGLIVDHPAYSGVFWRTAPRYSGTVYESID